MIQDRDRVLLLDGATGTELRARGVEVPSHVTSIWSARALTEAPDAVVQVHRDYIEAGADVVTANNYAVTPPLVGHGVEVLARILDRPFGGYAHTADVVLSDEGEAPVAVEDLQWKPLDVDRYTAAAEGWLDAGARIVGGCCSTGPAHIARLRALIDGRDGRDERAQRGAP